MKVGLIAMNHNNVNHLLKSTSFKNSDTFYSDLYHIPKAAKEFFSCKLNDKSYYMIAFDIDNLKELHQSYNAKHIFSCIYSTLESYIKAPNLYCRINEDNFAILIEECTTH